MRISLGNAAGLPAESYDCITIPDVLYLLPGDGKYRLLSDCFDALKPGGLLLLKEVDTKPRWKYAVAKAEEVLAVKIARFTQGNAVDFLPSGDCTELLGNIGFEGAEVMRLDRGYPHPYVLVSGKRPHKTVSKIVYSAVDAA